METVINQIDVVSQQGAKCYYLNETTILGKCVRIEEVYEIQSKGLFEKKKKVLVAYRGYTANNILLWEIKTIQFCNVHYGPVRRPCVGNPKIFI